jgi:hypothetical protein
VGTRVAHTSFLCGKPEGTSPFGRPRRRWKNNIKIYLPEIESESLTVINLAQHRHKCLAVLNKVMNLPIS